MNNKKNTITLILLELLIIGISFYPEIIKCINLIEQNRYYTSLEIVKDSRFKEYNEVKSKEIELEIAKEKTNELETEINNINSSTDEKNNKITSLNKDINKKNNDIKNKTNERNNIKKFFE